MTTPIYEWSGDYFCGGCIVFVIIEHEPYSQWLEDENTPENNTTRDNLELIKEFLQARGLDTSELPHKLRKKPDGMHFCANCLNFFDEQPSKGTP